MDDGFKILTYLIFVLKILSGAVVQAVRKGRTQLSDGLFAVFLLVSKAKRAEAIAKLGRTR